MLIDSILPAAGAANESVGHLENRFRELAGLGAFAIGSNSPGRIFGEDIPARQGLFMTGFAPFQP
jgi:hypothetical protein